MASPVTSTSDNPFAAFASNAKAAAAEASDSGQDRFMTLLVAQMQNQDPLNPLDNAQVTTQLAQINTVKGIDQLNQTLQKMLGNSDSAQMLQAATIVGRTALVAGSTLELGSDGARGGFELKQSAENVAVSIVDASGRVVHRADLGPTAAGLHGFAWDGKTDAGTAAAAGQYSFKVSALTGGKTVAVDTLSAAVVDGITPGQGGLNVQARGIGAVPIAQVRQIM